MLYCILLLHIYYYYILYYYYIIHYYYYIIHYYYYIILYTILFSSPLLPFPSFISSTISSVLPSSIMPIPIFILYLSVLTYTYLYSISCSSHPLIYHLFLPDKISISKKNTHLSRLKGITHLLMFRLREYIYLSIHSILVGSYLCLFISYTILSSSSHSSDQSSVLPHLSLPPPKGIVPSSPIFILYLSVLTYTYLYSSVLFYPNLLIHSILVGTYIYLLISFPISLPPHLTSSSSPHLIHSILVDTYIYLLISFPISHPPLISFILYLSILIYT